MRRRRDDGRVAGGVSAPRVHRRGAAAVSRGRRMRAGASRRRCAGECSPAGDRRLDLGGSQSAAGRGGSYSRRSIGRAMGWQRGGRRVVRHFGGAARGRIHNRNQDRGARIRRRRIRVAGRDSSAHRVSIRRRNRRRRLDSVAIVERTSEVSRRRRDAHRRSRDAVEIAHAHRVRNRRQHPRRAIDASRRDGARGHRSLCARGADCGGAVRTSYFRYLPRA